MSLAMDDRSRLLLLAAEIAGYVHDLGKAHPGFADEKLVPAPRMRKEGQSINESHGMILELGRIYPTECELEEDQSLRSLLASLLDSTAWAGALHLSPEHSRGNTVQALGLGAPLRQHHANKHFPVSELSLIGDLYTFGADVRDSALDKNSGNAQKDVTAQHRDHAEIIDAFGHRAARYSEQTLRECWDEATRALSRVLKASPTEENICALRRDLLASLEPAFRCALGETRTPTNDVTLHHHARSTASFFKAAVAECILRGDFKHLQDDNGFFDKRSSQLIRFRLLGIRWDWRSLAGGMFRPASVAALSEKRRDTVAGLRTLFEEDLAIGNLIYEDDDGVIVLLPGFHESGEDGEISSERLFVGRLLDPVSDQISRAVATLGTGVAFRLCWTEPTLYLTDYREALGLASSARRTRHLQAGEAYLRALWERSNTSGDLMHICPQCGIRPAFAQEHSLTSGGLAHHTFCTECEGLGDEAGWAARADRLSNDFGFETGSFNLSRLAVAGDSRRIALVSVRVDKTAIASGQALLTQLAAPVRFLKEGSAAAITSATQLGDWLQDLVVKLRSGDASGVKAPLAKTAQDLIGDRHWLKESDARGSALEVLDQLFLRESAGLPEELGLARHEGDRVALFAMRKHPSPARIQRIWDDLRALWRDIAGEVRTALGGRLIPLTLDDAGVRFAVSAAEADTAISLIESRLSQTLSKVRGGIAAHVSCVVMQDRFPLYLALDALERLDARVPLLPHQTWEVASTRKVTAQTHQIAWNTPQGLVEWSIDVSANEGTQTDVWHPHVLVTHRRGATGTLEEVIGPDRIVHMTELHSGDRALIPPMTFDYLVLDGSARRHQIHYTPRGAEISRPHWVLGVPGMSPLLLERYSEFSRLVGISGWDLSRLKSLQGEIIETYEKWVRDVPAALRENGLSAWKGHVRNILLRHGPKNAEKQDELFDAITSGRFFDAVEWRTFVSKTTQTSEALA